MFIECALLCTVVSCGGDEEPEPTLKGTVWRYVETEFYDGKAYTYSISFDFTTEASGICKLESTYDSQENETVVLTYIYSHPDVTMLYEGDALTGTINGNVLIVEGLAYEKQ